MPVAMRFILEHFELKALNSKTGQHVDFHKEYIAGPFFQINLLTSIFATVLFIVGCAQHPCTRMDKKLIEQVANSSVPQSTTAATASSRILAVLARIHVGQSEIEVERVLSEVFVKNPTTSLLDRFRSIVPITNALIVSEWQSSWKEPDGWPQLIFVLFENTNKAALVDALWCVSGTVRPIVPGVYDLSPVGSN